MCVLAFAWRAHPRWSIVLAGNRDELHARPASPLAHWDESHHIIAGRDLRSGGTWLGVSKQGRLAVVTNLRGYGAPAVDRVSRGALVSDFLARKGRYADPATIDVALFNPFNLIVADAGRALFLSNRPEAIRWTLASGVYGLSNGALDEPWPKTMRLKRVMLDWLKGPADRPELLLDGLREEALPRVGTALASASNVPQEPGLSSIFIRDAVYGTRCGTVVAIDRAGQGVIIERRYADDATLTGETRLGFAWTS